jgi:hypothetical protein
VTPAAGRLPAALTLALLAAAPASAARLEVVDATGAVALAAPLGPDGRWCLVWNHSVAGIAVRDCFRGDGGRLVLERSHQPDFAAGLGHIPGRGEVVSDAAHGYWIEGIDAAMPATGLPLRVGSARVAHRLAVGERVIPLPAALAGERVTIRLVAAD